MEQTEIVAALARLEQKVADQERRITHLELQDEKTENQINEFHRQTAKARGVFFVLVGVGSLGAWILTSWDKVLALFRAGSPPH